MNVPAIAAHMSGQHAAACRRSHAAAEPDWHTGTHYLSSDGASGSYADAATSAAARVVFGGAGAPVFTVACWVRASPTGSGYPGHISDDGVPGFRFVYDGGGDGLIGELISAGGGGTDLLSTASASSSAWLLLAFTSDGADESIYIDGANAGTNTIPAGPYATVDTLTLFADYAHGNLFAGDIRDFAIWDRALSAAEVAALHTAGVGHDLRDNVGAYTGGGPEHWWPADGDSGTTVTDRGSVGGCSLTLHGGVTIEEV